MVFGKNWDRDVDDIRSRLEGNPTARDNAILNIAARHCEKMADHYSETDLVHNALMDAAEEIRALLHKIKPEGGDG